MDRNRLIVAAIVGLVGLVWMGQGLGLVPGTFMSSNPLWVLIGAVLIGGAVLYAALPRLRGGGGTG